ncbi:MAG: DUF2344 domain-containing protein [Ruminococcus sp.]|nr:DUF2344 domain-containing protein [Ruminococcus sp.]
MKNARVFFTKDGACKYISHLDTNRVMLRAIGKSRLDIWHTEGFHQHAYITFALPLSLGYASTCESMDFRLLDDNADMAAIPALLNACLPEGIRVYRCAEAKCKPADIDSATYDIHIEPMNPDDISEKELYEKLNNFLAQPEIIVEKKTKKGMKNVDLKGYILSCDLSCDDGVGMTMKLPAGSTLNINPSLFVTAFSAYCGVDLHSDVTRTGIYTKEGNPFE